MFISFIKYSLISFGLAQLILLLLHFPSISDVGALKSIAIDNIRLMLAQPPSVSMQGVQAISDAPQSTIGAMSVAAKWWLGIFVFAGVLTLIEKP